MDSGKRDNSCSSKPGSKTDNPTDGDMDFLEVIVNISKALEKAQERPPNLKTLLRFLV